MGLSKPLRASAQHIELLQDKRRRLSDALVSAELQFVAALRRECLDGEMTWAQLREAYSVLSAGRLPGLRARWMDAIPVSPEEVILNARQEAALLSAELRLLAVLRRGARSAFRSTADNPMVLAIDRLLAEATPRMLPMISLARIRPRAARALVEIANGRPWRALRRR